MHFACKATAFEDVSLNGEVKNTNNSVIFSETGDININTSNTNFSGLIYAPYGDIVIDTDNLNLNNVVIIGQTITLDCPSINANYSTYMAELVGTESDIDVEIYAMGEYNSEASSIDIEWYTNYTNNSYEIWISNDNEEYTSIGVVSDETTYQYPITKGFEKRYFKISLTTNYGEYIESVPFLVTKTEEGYSVDFLDSDEDGLPDIYEIMIGTDVNNPDTDNDDLTDYQEVYITGTNPTKYDSVTEGVSDANSNSDGDGLSNAQEIELNTDPQLSDTDDDGLSDYDEIYVYGTDPLNPDTFGIPDAEYKVEQTISADSGVLAEINTAENAYELFIDIKTNGYAEKEVTVSKSSYSYAIENDAMIGASTDISISDICNPEEIVLKYNIKEAYIDNTLNLYSSLEEFQGIKRLNVFKFDEDKNMLLPVNTEFDVENGLLYAEVDELGTYCIMDMEIWLNNLGVEMPEESQNEENAMYFNSPSILSESEDSGSVWTPTYVNAPIDLVFILQSAGTSYSYFDTEKQLIIDFASSVIKDYSNVKITVIEFKKDKVTLVTDALGREYFTNIQMLFDALNNIEYVSENDYCDRGQAFKILLNDMSLDFEHDIYVYKIINGANTSHTSYNNEDVISKVKNNEIRSYSEIRPYGWHYIDSVAHERISSAIIENNDLFINLDISTLSSMINHFPTKLSPARPVYEILLPTCWKKIALDGELSPDNDIDTDSDTLTDWEETDTEQLIWNDDGSFDIPKLNISNIVLGMKRFNSLSEMELLLDGQIHYYLPILSDPTEVDSDGDKLMDINDVNPLSQSNYSKYLINVAKSKKTEALQRSLEYLGYFDLPKGEQYGTCGGLTSAAIQLFQLNHRMFEAEKSFKFLPSYYPGDTYYIDTNTYYAIIKEALDNGYSNYPSNLSHEFDLSDYDRQYKPKSIPLEEFNASLNPDNPVIISSVLRKNVSEAYSNTDKVNIYVYDYTPVVDAMLLQGAQIFHFHHYKCNCGTPNTLQPYLSYVTYSDSKARCGLCYSDYPWMISQVKNNALFDVKTKNSWNTFMSNLNADIHFYTSSFLFMYKNEIINAEILGNILFGFAGHAGGYSKSELLNGGSLYSYFTSKKGIMKRILII